MNHPKRNRTQTDYLSRINTVFDYIEQHIEEDLSLDELARVSCFSKYHFSRIFDAMVGETPFEFIKRVRLEKAATLLQTEPGESVTRIALRCGFEDLSVFSRNFSNRFGVSPTTWRTNRSEIRNQNQMSGTPSYYLEGDVNNNHNMEQLQGTEIRMFPKMTVAYVRHTGPYSGDEALFNRLFGRLFEWAGPRGLSGQKGCHPMVIYHDDPCVTEKENLRMSVCLPVPPDTPVDGEIGKMELSGGRFLSAGFRIAPSGMPSAWQWIYGSWFPSSGYQPADALPYEVYPEPPEAGKLTVEIRIPLKPL